MSEQQDLALLIHGHTPILQIETFEEKRALSLIIQIATSNVIPVFKWTITEGLTRLDIDLGSQRHNAEPKDVLGHIKSTGTVGLYVLLDFHPYIDDPVNARYVREIAMAFESKKSKLIFISHKIGMPPSISRLVARFELSLPDENALELMVSDEARSWQRESGQRVSTDRKTLSRLVKNLRGLAFNDCRRLIRNAIVDDGAITDDDLPEVMKAKYRLLNRDDVLSFEFDTARFSDVGGMRKLKQWLQQREQVFNGQHAIPGLDPPKGLLLLGVQGCGKSLAAKAIAGVWKVPLLRFDFGALYNKYIGESEKNLRDSLKTAEVMAPCVMWVDEIEKGIAGGSDEGTSKRMLGTLLTWLAEKKSNVFVVATANDIEDLPPELIRKGRLDEIFFVDLPKLDVRRRILAIHFEKRHVDLSNVDLDVLAECSEGFSGAEIEQAVVSAIYSSHANGNGITTQHMIELIKATRPLSVVMDAKIARLRQWAESRTVPVD
jgi:SpoVK/Ycf46/Vps4 family AAA+-type ATPase